MGSGSSANKKSEKPPDKPPEKPPEKAEETPVPVAEAPAAEAPAAEVAEAPVPPAAEAPAAEAVVAEPVTAELLAAEAPVAKPLAAEVLAAEAPAAVDPVAEVVVENPTIDLQEYRNRLKHNTSLFGQHSKLLVRRAASFGVKLGGIQSGAAKSVVFSLSGTSLTFAATINDSDGSGWRLEEKADGELEIAIPPQAPIGTYSAEVELGPEARKAFPKQVVVLFNPWGEADDVYLANEEKLGEYVLEDDGAIWVGASHNRRPRAWFFGQYEEGVLDACLKLVEMFPGDRGNVVLMARHLSSAVNQLDNGGVLVGNWSGDYDGGKSPTAWVGSPPILTQWAESGPVKFGQCWVFSGVLTAVCRCLGIPARSVTCFDSAHDTNFNRVIDKFFDTKGEKMSMGGDSIWNFHVWNDVWFLRRDLTEGRGGWQAIDATPQEQSEGRWQCGPASLVDVKAGTASAESNYDLDFVLAEVNADVRYYVVDADGEKKLRRVERDAVGTYVITKAVGYLGADDITGDYKHPEGTIAERVALLGEAGDSTFKPAEKGTFSLSPVGELALGEDIAFKLKLKDDAADRWLCRLALRATSYRGREIEVMAESSMLLEAGQEMTVSVKPADYLKYLADTDFPVSAIVHCVEVENASMWLDEVVASIGAPELEVTVPAARPFSSPVTVRWRNPLPVTLTGCRLEVAAAGVLLESKDIGELAIGAELSEAVPLKEPDPTRTWANGHMQVVATLTSKEVNDVVGYADIKMQ